MNFELSVIFSFTIIIAAIAGIARWKRTDPVFLPFLILIITSAVNEVVSFFIVRSGHYNVFQYNFFSLAESGLVLWQFINWGLFRRRSILRFILPAGLLMVWVAESFIRTGLHQFNSCFIVLYSACIVLMSINMINKVMFKEPSQLFQNSVFLICPSRGSGKTVDDFKKIADDFNKKGEICKKNGIKFAYHNHEYGFKAIDEQFPQDIMMKNTDTSLVDFEMDIYWVVTGKQNPIDWLKKYPNRFKLGHFKDRIKGATERDATCTLGTGAIDFPGILKVAKKNGMKYFIVEQEKYEGTTPLLAAKDDAAYMRKLL